MLGLYSLSAAALSSLGDSVHVLSVLEGAACEVDVRITVGISAYVLDNASGSTSASGPNANGSSVLDSSSGNDQSQLLSVIGGSVLEQAETSDTAAALFSSVPLYIVENTVAEDQPPFARQRWEFVKTSTGGQWVLVRTGE